MSDKNIFASTASKAGTDARPPLPSPAKSRINIARMDVKYVLETLLIDPDLIEEQILGKQVNHVIQLTALNVEEDPLPGITEANKRSIRRFQQWYKWKRSQQPDNKLPFEWQWRHDFNIDELYADFEESRSVPSSIDGRSFTKSKSTSTAIDANESFRVKLSEYPSFSGKGHEWYSFREQFEATCDAAGFDESLLTFEESEEQNHLDRRDDDDEYDALVTKFYKVLKFITAKGTAKSKVRKFAKTKDGVLAYSYLRRYYDLDGDKRVYGTSVLNEVLQLELHYNSPGGFDSYLSKFEEYCTQLDDCDQGLSEQQKHTFFLSGIKDEDYTAIKDQCDKKSFDESVLDLRTKAIKLGKAGGSKRFKRRTNKVTTEEEDEKDNQQMKIKLLEFPLETWKLLSPEVKSMYGMLRKAAREGTIVKLEYGSQYGSNRKAKKTTKKKDGQAKQDESTPVSDSEKDPKPVRFQLAKNLQSGTIKQNMKKQVRNVDTRRALAKTSSRNVEGEIAYLDNAADTFGIGGTAWIVESLSEKTVHIEGYSEDATTSDVPIGNAVTALDLPDGETLILHANEGTVLGDKANTLASEKQMEANGVIVRTDESGRKYIEADNYIIPLTVKEAMQTFNIRRPTDHELRTCVHVHLTSDLPWNPEEINDREITSAEYDALISRAEDRESRLMKLKKNIRRMTTSRLSNWQKFNRFFLYPGENIMKDTLRHNTMAGKLSRSVPMRKHHKSRNPLLSRNRLREGYATDTIFSKVTSFEGFNCAQGFVGIDSKYRSIFGMKSEKHGPEAMLDFFRQEGVPVSLTRDNSRMQTSATWNEYMRRYWVKDNFTEPYHPGQNPFERDQALWKRDSTKIMIDSKVDPRGWFRVMCHTADLHNHRANSSNEDNIPPLTKAKGEIGDITLLTEFQFNEDILYQDYNYKFPAEGGNEKPGKWYGRALNHGDGMCSWILTADDELIVRSNIRSARKDRPNATFVDELDLKLKGSDTHDVPFLDGPFVKVDELADKGEHHETQVFYPHEFDIIDLDLNYTTTSRNGKETTKKAVIKERISEEDYRIELSNGKNRVLTYQELISMLNKDDEDDVERWTFEEIKGHRWSKDTNRKGRVDVLISWEGYEEDSWEPMEVIKKDDPVTLAKYAYDNDLTDKAVWKWAKRYSKNVKKLKRMVRNLRASKRSSRGIKYQFGVRVPRNIAEAYQLDEANGNSLWTEAIDREVKLLRDDFECFRVGEESDITEDYQKIPLLWAFAVKFDGRHRARLCAGGHRTRDPETDYYSGVVELETVRILFVIAALKKFKVIAADVASAYVQALTDELVYAIAGQEFGPWSGKILIIVKALYGLKSSGAMWHQKLSDNLRDMGFRPCNADFDLWMRDRGDHYEYIAVMVDDLLIFSKEPLSIIEPLHKIWGYSLKGVGSPEYYSGADIEWDKERQCWTLGAKTYIKSVCDRIEKLLETPLKNTGSPLDAGDHPEMDDTDLLVPSEIPIYQMMIGCLQWAVTLGRYDIQYATNTLARFGQKPREGHFKRALRVFGYLKYHARGKLYLDPSPISYDGIDFKDEDWTECYPDAEEYIDENAPVPKIDTVPITVFKDASHATCLDTRRSVTGILILLGSAPIFFYSKRQNTVESSTYGSELVAMRIAIENLLGLRYKLRMMGMDVEKCSTLLGDNNSVIVNTQLPSSSIKKKHNSVAFHKAREAVAAGYVRTGHINSTENPSDVLTKAVSPTEFYRLTGPILYNTTA